MEISIIITKIPLVEVKKAAEETFGDMVKAVADIEEGSMAIGGEMHADCEAKLLEHGSEQKNLWGFNIYPDRKPDEWLEYQSLINIRPSVGNRSMEIQDEAIRRKIAEIVNALIQ